MKRKRENREWLRERNKKEIERDTKKESRKIKEEREGIGGKEHN